MMYNINTVIFTIVKLPMQVSIGKSSIFIITSINHAGLQMLKLMSKQGTPPDHLLRTFISFIHPILEYAAPVWHFKLTAEQSARLERVQKIAENSSNDSIEPGIHFV
jgi:hypothetical protein